nr:hypothetical protein [Kibdelosporangium sp. MJ126-NF4]
MAFELGGASGRGFVVRVVVGALEVVVGVVVVGVLVAVVVVGAEVVDGGWAAGFSRPQPVATRVRAAITVMWRRMDRLYLRPSGTGPA